jgi:uncharacterized protein (TIGR02186 family)
MKRLLSIILLSLLAQPANAQDIGFERPLIGAVSSNKISMNANFNGQELLFFGAKNAAGDIVIVLRGPYAKSAVLRRKAKVAGMWMMVEHAKYKQIPAFYRIASTKPLSEILSQKQYAQLGIGNAGLQAELAQNNAANGNMDKALLNKLRKNNWLNTSPSRIDYIGESVFRGTMALPNNLPRGQYLAEIFLLQNGQLISSQTIAIKAQQQGFDAWLALQAHHAPLLYGIASVILALIGGWLGNRLLGR